MTGGIGQDDILPVREVLLTGVGHKNKKPLLVAFVEQDLLIYEAFAFAESSLEGHLNLRFKKVCGVNKVLLLLFLVQLVRALHRHRKVTSSNPVEVLNLSGFSM